jgi:hypothetical protein
MEIHFALELQAKIDQLAVETGRALDKLVGDAMAGYVAELVATAKCSTAVTTTRKAAG